MSEAPDLIAGRYRIERRLGLGGMSTVQLAVDTRLEREVAVKLLAEHLAEDPTFVSRFQREALAAARLVHPNIVQVFDSGLDEASGRHYIVMEYVDGRSCAQLLRDRGHLEVQDAIFVVEQACKGLEYAHRNGVVHRDVKPGNLLVSRDGTVKLADFGIAKATEQSSITQVGSVLGTAAYLAPEQARGEEAGPAADLYSLGVVTYQLLSGRLPYEASSLSELTLMQQRELPTRLDEIAPDVPPSLARAVARALSIDPGARYTDALAMADALRDGARGIDPPDAAPGADGGTAATRLVRPGDTGTAATSIAAAGAAGAAAGAVAARQPRQPRRIAPVDAPATPARAAGRSADRPRKSGRGRRIAVVLVVLAALVGAGAIVVASQVNSDPQLQRVIYRDAQRAIDALQSLINDNTR